VIWVLMGVPPLSDHVKMTTRVIQLRYQATCSRCRTNLAPSTRAAWDAEAGLATCLPCMERALIPESATGPGLPHEERVSSSRTPTAPRERPAAGIAGASARLEYERRRSNREHGIEQRWGRLAGIVKFLSDDPRSTRVWALGSSGEQRLAEGLTKRVGDRVVLLHDRKVPGTRANIDHIAVAASGVWVIDTKTYRGRIERRDLGGWRKRDLRLIVDGRDRTNLVRGLDWQIEAAKRVLGGHPIAINGVLCFIDSDWGLLPRPFKVGTVWVTWGKSLAEMLAAPGPLTPWAILVIAERLAAALPSASGK
jgi:hypothetical protein